MNASWLSWTVVWASVLSASCAISFDYEDDDIRPSYGRCPWIRNKLKNGRVKIRSRGRIAKFQCNSGYDMVGKRFATCVRGQWNNPIPFCVAPGCYKLREPTNGKVTEMYSGALLVYDCLPGYSLQGPMSVYCDGIRWSDTPPLCDVSVDIPDTFCDFEDPELCGWSQDPTADFEWKRNQFSTPSGHVGTGPTHDHTFGKDKAGFYLYLEASSPRKENDICRIFSPVFSPTYSPGCFVFWYHMHGATIGGLRVYVKSEIQVFDEVTPAWEKRGDQGDQWLRGEIEIPTITENFQIIIEGIRGSGYVGDTAIDDVNLWSSNCSSVPEGSTEITSLNSCRGRCREQGDISTCECVDSCIVNNTCCSDYFKICTVGSNSSSGDGETPPPYVVTDYLNALGKNQTTEEAPSVTATVTTAGSSYSYALSSTFTTGFPLTTTLRTSASPPTTTSIPTTTTSTTTVPTTTSTASTTTTTASTTAKTNRPTSTTTRETTTRTATTPPTTSTTTQPTTTPVASSRSTTTVQITTPARPTTTTAATTTPKTTTAVISSTLTSTQSVTGSSSTPLSTKSSVVTAASTTTSTTVLSAFTSNDIHIHTTPVFEHKARFPPRMSSFSPYTPILRTVLTTVPSTIYTAPRTSSTTTISTTTTTTTTTAKPTTTRKITTVAATDFLSTDAIHLIPDKNSATGLADEMFDSYQQISDKISHLPATKQEQEHSNVGVTVAVVLIVAVALIAGAIFIYKRQTHTQGRLKEDSEIRFLSDNEVVEFSETSEKAFVY